MSFLISNEKGGLEPPFLLSCWMLELFVFDAIPDGKPFTLFLELLYSTLSSLRSPALTVKGVSLSALSVVKLVTST